MFVLGGLLLTVYVWLVGVDALQRAITHVPPRRIISLVIVGIVPVVIWGSALHLIFVRFDIATRLVTSILLFSAAGFLNSVTPFGQAGGDPVSAVLFKRTLGTDFETGLAAIGSVNALNRLGSLMLGVIGVGYLGTQVAFGRTLQTAAVTILTVTAGTLGCALVAWHYRERLIHWSAGGLTLLMRPVARLPGVTPPSRDSLIKRGYRFTDAVTTLTHAPKTLAFVFGAGVAGHLAVASTLWVALAALGVEAPISGVLLLIPVAKLSGAAPTPGGFGSAEAVLTALLVATIGVEAAIAGAAALLYRASAFWLPALTGGVATAWYGLRHPSYSRSHSVTQVSAQSGSETALLGSERDDEQVRLPVLVLAVSVILVILVAAGVHGRQLLVEPDSVLVHTTRDAGLVVLSFGLTWLTLRQVTMRWID